MSLPVIVWVFEKSEEKLGRRLVLLALAEFAHDDGTRAWPSVATICQRTRMSRRAVQEALRGLESAESVVKTGESKLGTSIYSIIMGGAESARGGALSDMEGAQNPSDRGADSAPDPLEEHPLEEQELAPAAQARPRDLIWDELERRFGAVAEKTNAHAKRNKAVVDLKRQDATVDLVRTALRAWPQIFPGATVTDTALATHFVQLTVHASASRRVDAAPVAEVVNLPEITDEGRAQNLARVRALSEGIGHA